jgi:hypothetical protein
MKIPLYAARRLAASFPKQSCRGKTFFPAFSTLSGRRSNDSHLGLHSAILPAIAAVTAMGLMSSSNNNLAKAEPNNLSPKHTKHATPIDWNVVFSMSKDVDDGDRPEEKGKDCGCKKKKKTTTANKGAEGDDEDEEDTDEVPDYIAETARRDLGNSLNPRAHLGQEAENLLRAESQYPIERAQLTMAPEVPPPCNRNYPVHLVVDIMTINKKMRVQGSKYYEFWPFAFLDQRDGRIKAGVPGPFIRGTYQKDAVALCVFCMLTSFAARVGDILQVNHTNKDESGMAHSIDFHSVCGPGGGSPTTFAEQDETRTGAYRLMKPGLYIYHCAAAPIPLHIHNGKQTFTL